MLECVAFPFRQSRTNLEQTLHGRIKRDLEFDFLVTRWRVVQHENVFPLRVNLGDVQVSQVSRDLEFMFENRGEVVGSLVVFHDNLVAEFQLMTLGESVMDALRCIFHVQEAAEEREAHSSVSPGEIRMDMLARVVLVR